MKKKDENVLLLQLIKNILFILIFQLTNCGFLTNILNTHRKFLHCTQYEILLFLNETSLLFLVYESTLSCNVILAVAKQSRRFEQCTVQ